MVYYIRNLYYILKSEVFDIPGRIIALLFVISILVLPALNDHPYMLRILSLTAIFAIYAASWDLLAGFTGQVNLGQGLFFGASAYAGAKLSACFGLSPWISIPLGGIIAVGMGLVVALPALRLRGFYLSLVTLALPVILTGIIFMFPDFTGGELGIYGIDRLSNSRVISYYIIVIVMLVSIFAMYKITDEESKYIRMGIILNAIREDEIAARASGIDTAKYKVIAFALSGFFAGIAGGLYVFYMRVAGPSTLELIFSFQAILWTVFGGMATIYGAVVGVYLLYPMTEFVQVLPHGEEFRFILQAGLLILILVFMPEGLSPWVRDKIEIRCPRCKLINMIIRKNCRACRAPLHLTKDKDID